MKKEEEYEESPKEEQENIVTPWNINPFCIECFLGRTPARGCPPPNPYPHQTVYMPVITTTPYKKLPTPQVQIEKRVCVAVLIGPPKSGKTAFCRAVVKYFGSSCPEFHVGVMPKPFNMVLDEFIYHLKGYLKHLLKRSTKTDLIQKHILILVDSNMFIPNDRFQIFTICHDLNISFAQIYLYYDFVQVYEKCKHLVNEAFPEAHLLRVLALSSSRCWYEPWEANIIMILNGYEWDNGYQMARLHYFILNCKTLSKTDKSEEDNHTRINPDERQFQFQNDDNLCRQEQNAPFRFTGTNVASSSATATNADNIPVVSIATDFNNDSNSGSNSEDSINTIIFNNTSRLNNINANKDGATWNLSEPYSKNTNASSSSHNFNTNFSDNAVSNISKHTPNTTTFYNTPEFYLNNMTSTHLNNCNTISIINPSIQPLFTNNESFNIKNMISAEDLATERRTISPKTYTESLSSQFSDFSSTANSVNTNSINYTENRDFSSGTNSLKAVPAFEDNSITAELRKSGANANRFILPYDDSINSHLNTFAPNTNSNRFILPNDDRINSHLNTFAPNTNSNRFILPNDDSINSHLNTFAPNADSNRFILPNDDSINSHLNTFAPNTDSNRFIISNDDSINSHLNTFAPNTDSNRFSIPNDDSINSHLNTFAPNRDSNRFIISNDASMNSHLNTFAPNTDSNRFILPNDDSINSHLNTFAPNTESNRFILPNDDSINSHLNTVAPNADSNRFILPNDDSINSHLNTFAPNTNSNRFILPNDDSINSHLNTFAPNTDSNRFFIPNDYSMNSHLNTFAPNTDSNRFILPNDDSINSHLNTFAPNTDSNRFSIPNDDSINSHLNTFAPNRDSNRFIISNDASMNSHLNTFAPNTDSNRFILPNDDSINSHLNTFAPHTDSNRFIIPNVDSINSHLNTFAPNTDSNRFILPNDDSMNSHLNTFAPNTDSSRFILPNDDSMNSHLNTFGPNTDSNRFILPNDNSINSHLNTFAPNTDSNRFILPNDDSINSHLNTFAPNTDSNRFIIPNDDSINSHLNNTFAPNTDSNRFILPNDDSINSHLNTFAPNTDSNRFIIPNDDSINSHLNTFAPNTDSNRFIIPNDDSINSHLNTFAPNTNSFDSILSQLRNFKPNVKENTPYLGNTFTPNTNNFNVTSTDYNGIIPSPIISTSNVWRYIPNTTSFNTASSDSLTYQIGNSSSNTNRSNTNVDYFADSVKRAFYGATTNQSDNSVPSTNSFNTNVDCYDDSVKRAYDSMTSQIGNCAPNTNSYNTNVQCYADSDKRAPYDSMSSQTGNFTPNTNNNSYTDGGTSQFSNTNVNTNHLNPTLKDLIDSVLAENIDPRTFNPCFTYFTPTANSFNTADGDDTNSINPTSQIITFAPNTFDSTTTPMEDNSPKNFADSINSQLMLPCTNNSTPTYADIVTAGHCHLSSKTDAKTYTETVDPQVSKFNPNANSFIPAAKTYANNVAGSYNTTIKTENLSPEPNDESNSSNTPKTNDGGLICYIPKITKINYTPNTNAITTPNISNTSNTPKTNVVLKSNTNNSIVNTNADKSEHQNNDGDNTTYKRVNITPKTDNADAHRLTSDVDVKPNLDHYTTKNTRFDSISKNKVDSTATTSLAGNDKATVKNTNASSNFKLSVFNPKHRNFCNKSNFTYKCSQSSNNHNNWKSNRYYNNNKNNDSTKTNEGIYKRTEGKPDNDLTKDDDTKPKNDTKE